MGKADYPGPGDLSLFLTESGLRLSGGTDLVTAAAAGALEFEHRTGRKMLAQAASYSYDLPTGLNGKLVLRRELLACASLSVAGTPRVLNTDFWLYPEDGGEDGRPYTQVEILGAPYYPWWGQQRRRAVAISGTWGYGATLPEDAWSAMLMLGALRLTEELRGAALWSPVVKTRTEGHGAGEKQPGTMPSETYDAALWEPLRKGWADQAAAVTAYYCRSAGYLG